MSDVSVVVLAVPASPIVDAQVVAAVASTVSSGLVSSGLRFSMGDRNACAAIIRRDGVVDVMAVDGGRVVGWPFAKTASALGGWRGYY